MDQFRKLSDEEEREYLRWAGDNYKPGEPIKGIWHPVIQAECVRLNALVLGVEESASG